MKNKKKQTVLKEEVKETKVEFDKDFYEKYKASLVVSSRKRIVIGVALVIALVTLGGLTAGHFAYKATHTDTQETIDQRIIIDPMVSDKVNISNIAYDKEGNATFNVEVKDKSKECFRGAKVYIGNQLLNEKDDYELTPANKITNGTPESGDGTKYIVLIYKSALDKYQGKINVVPTVDVVRCKVSFDVIDPTTKETIEVEPQHVGIGEKITWPIVNVGEGYVIKGYTTDSTRQGSFYDFSKAVTSIEECPNVLYAVFDETELLTVSFNSNGGSDVPSQSVKMKSKLAEPVVTYAGHKLDGWYTESTFTNKVNFSTYEVTASITLYAKWVEVFNVTFDSNGGSYVAAQTVESGNKVTKPDVPTKTGYTFNTWQLNGSDYNFDNPVTANITLKATWIAKEYEIKFLSYDGSKELQKGNVAYGVVPSYSGETPTKPSATGVIYEFIGWNTTKEAGSKITIPAVTSAATYYAQFKEVATTCTVSFDSNGGTYVAPKTVTYNTAVTAPDPAPTKSGYVLKGWKNGSTLYDFDSKVTSNITLTAYWEAIPATKIVISSSSTEIVVGGKTTLTATVTPSTVVTPVTWAITSGTNYAEIAQDGTLVGKAIGEVTVVGKIGTITSNSLTITVGVTGLKFDLNSGSSGYIVSSATTKPTGVLNIPSSYNGKNVVEIAESAFSGCSGLTMVVIPETITTIGAGAFSGLTGIEKVVFMDLSKDWTCNNSESTQITSTDLADVTVAAGYLTTALYGSYKWIKNAS